MEYHFGMPEMLDEISAALRLMLVSSRSSIAE